MLLNLYLVILADRSYSINAADMAEARRIAVERYGSYFSVCLHTPAQR